MLPFVRYTQSEKAVYLLRPFVHVSLHDRIVTRPFLSTAEKKWLAFQARRTPRRTGCATRGPAAGATRNPQPAQLLTALAHCEERGVVHGDIKAGRPPPFARRTPAGGVPPPTSAPPAERTSVGRTTVGRTSVGPPPPPPRRAGGELHGHLLGVAPPHRL